MGKHKDWETYIIQLLILFHINYKSADIACEKFSILIHMPIITFKENSVFNSHDNVCYFNSAKENHCVFSESYFFVANSKKYIQFQVQYFAWYTFWKSLNIIFLFAGFFSLAAKFWTIWKISLKLIFDEIYQIIKQMFSRSLRIILPIRTETNFIKENLT